MFYRENARNASPAFLSALMLLMGVALPGTAAGQEAAKQGGRSIEIVYSSPREFLDSYFMASEAVGTTNVLKKSGVAVHMTSVGAGVFTDGCRYLLPRESTTDFRAVPRVLAGRGELKREVLSDALPVLDSPYELRFQYPIDGSVDCLTRMQEDAELAFEMPDARLKVAVLARYTNEAGESILSLELPGSGPLLRNLTDKYRVVGALMKARTKDASTDLFVIVKPLYRGSRVYALLQDLLEPAESGAVAPDGPATPSSREKLYLHPGGIMGPWTMPEAQVVIGEALARLNPTAIVPRQPELMLGMHQLRGFADKHGIPYLGANLVWGKGKPGDKDSTRPFPRFVMTKVDGLNVGVVGMVGPDQIAQVPPWLRGDWKVEPPDLVLPDVIEAMHTQLGRPPDLTIVLISTDDANQFEKVMRNGAVDIVMGHFHTWLSAPVEQQLLLVRSDDGGAQPRSRRAPFGLRTSGLSVGTITVNFASGVEGGPLWLKDIVHKGLPVLDQGLVDAELETHLRWFDEINYTRFAQVMLPDVGPIVEKHKELEPLVWGDRILRHNRLIRREIDLPVAFTDPLMMQFVTNVMKQELGAEVAVALDALVPVFDMGPTTRGVFEIRFQALETVALVDLDGADLLALVGRLKLQYTSDGVRPTEYLFHAGVDVKRNKVGGRAINLKEQYRVAVGDSVLSVPGLRGIFSGKKVKRRFVPLDQGYAAKANGRRLPMRKLMTSAVERWGEPRTRQFDPANTGEFEDLLLDQSTRHIGQWSLRLDNLSAMGSRYANTGGSGPTGDYAASREARLMTLEHYNVMLSADVALLYDGPAVAWETRGKAFWQRLMDLDGNVIFESFDDLLAFTELRLNVLKVSIGKKELPMVPFLRAAYDTEFTAPAGYSHQHLLRAVVGEVAYLGSYVPEIRLGFVYQADLSDGPVRHDLGLMGSLRLHIPLGSHLSLTSSLDVRYLFPDDDDTAADLGLVLASVNKLVVPIWGGFSVYGFADLYYAMGKAPPTDEIAGSYMLGLGLQFAHIFKTRK